MARSSIYIIPEVTAGESQENYSLSFDVVTSFTHTKSRTVTSSPVSKGTFISEVLGNKGGKVSIEAYVAENPIYINKKNIIGYNTSDGRAKAAYLALDKLYNSLNTVTIVYKFDTLNSYFLTNFEPILMASNDIGFKLEFDEVRFATEKTVQLTVNMSDEKTLESSKELHTGINSKKTVSAKEEGILGGLFPTFGVTLESLITSGTTTPTPSP